MRLRTSIAGAGICRSSAFERRKFTMTTTRRILHGGALAVLLSGLASAESIGYLSNVVGPTTGNSYSMQLTKFDDQGGTRALDAVTLYFSAALDITNFTITSLD